VKNTERARPRPVVRAKPATSTEAMANARRMGLSVASVELVGHNFGRATTRVLAWAKVFLTELLAEAEAHGLTLSEQGILLRLLRTQHLAGSLPADVRAVRRLVGNAARLTEVRHVANLFFPIGQEGQRRNARHAEARDAAVLAYEKKVTGGRKGAARRWGEPERPDGIPIGIPNDIQ
jgi:hypothetical protein